MKKLHKVVQLVAVLSITDLDAGVVVLQELRAGTYEDLNQIQHEFMIVRAAEWLLTQKRVPMETVWFWNPRQTGPANEPDLRGEHQGAIVVSAEITTSTEPKGVIDKRMQATLHKLSVMDGDRFYFTASAAMCQRARTKIRKAAWRIEAVYLPAPAPENVGRNSTQAAGAP